MIPWRDIAGERYRAIDTDWGPPIDAEPEITQARPPQPTPARVIDLTQTDDVPELPFPTPDQRTQTE